MPPALTDYTYALDNDGLILNADGQALPFIDVTSITGLDSSPIRMTTNERESLDGTFINANHLSMRTVVISGTAYTNPNDPDSLLDQLRAAYSSPAVRPFYFKHPGQPIRFVNAQGGGMQYAVDQARRLGITDIQLSLLCGDPFIYDYPPMFGTAVLASTAQQNQQNLNATFESSVSPWTATGSATIARSGTNAKDGAFSLSITPNGTTANPGAVTESIAVAVGTSYTADVYLLASANWASGAQIVIKWFDVNTNLISSTTSTAVALTANVWTRLVISAQPPSTANGATASAITATMTVQAVGTPSSGTIFYLDDAYFYTDPGLAFNASFNVGFGQNVLPNSVQLQNNGTHDAYPSFVLTGPLSNPTIIDSINSINMKIALTLNANDTLLINSRDKTIILNGTANRRNAYQGLKWFVVPAGAIDTFVLTGDSGSGTMTAQIFNTYY